MLKHFTLNILLKSMTKLSYFNGSGSFLIFGLNIFLKSEVPFSCHEEATFLFSARKTLYMGLNIFFPLPSIRNAEGLYGLGKF